VKDELQFHLEAKVDDLVSRGWLVDAAKQEAERQFGDVKAVQAAGEKLARQRDRTEQRSDWWGACKQDVRYAARTLWRDRSFTVVTVLILAAGIAANTAVFSVVNTVLLRPLPFPDAERLTWFTGGKALPAEVVKSAGLGAVTFTVSAYEEFQKHNQSFQSVTSYVPFFGSSEYTLTGSGEPEPVEGVMVAGNFFQTLGVKPARGRLFLRDECQKGGPRVALLSDAFWHRQFAGDPAIIGRTITLSKRSVTVVGVLPAAFDFGAVFSPGLKIDVYVPAIMDEIRNWGNTLSMIGRLKPGVSIRRAQAEADLLYPRLKAAHKDWEMDYSCTLTGLKDFVSGKLRRALLLLWCAVSLIMLIVCVNLSNLLLARAVSRSKEFALRAALGASRGRLFRQLLVESLVLTGGGALLGLALAFTTTTYLAHQTSISLPLLSSIRLDAPALAWTLLISVAAALTFGFVPGLALATGNVQEGLKDSGHGMSAGRRHEALRSAMVISEVALASVLLIGAGLLFRSFLKVLDVDLGFEPSRAAVIKIDYDDGNSLEKRAAILQAMLRKVASIPGVEADGIADMLPLGRNRSSAFAIKGKAYPTELPGDPALVRMVTPGYLGVMGMHLRAGRDFTWRDGARAQPVMIINQTAARRFWPDKDALGQSVYRDGEKNEIRVVGIISDVRESSLEVPAEPEMYLPVTQADPEGAELVIRTKLPPGTIAPSVMKALRSLNPSQPASELRPLQQIVDHAISPRRFFVAMAGSFALLGLALASLGIYGVIAYSVSRQTQEIGIRMALGATAPQVQLGVVARALRLALGGVMLGTFVSILVTKWMVSLLFATEPTDPLTFGAIILLLSIVAVIAGYLPARRASRIDPMLALRAD
jgi:predicted permease